jgi:predicted Zn-dependent peptidase
MLSEFERLATDGITEEELVLAQGNISGGLALKFESTQARMSRLVAAEVVNGQFLDLDETLKHFKAVTAEEVRLLAADLAGRDRSIVAVGDITEKTFAPFV